MMLLADASLNEMVVGCGRWWTSTVARFCSKIVILVSGMPPSDRVGLCLSLWLTVARLSTVCCAASASAQATARLHELAHVTEEERSPKFSRA